MVTYSVTKEGRIYNEEKKNFIKAFPETQRDHIDYFINVVSHYGGEKGGLQETIAESNALLTTPKTMDILAIRSQYLQQYFPKTIAYLSEALSNERTPENKKPNNKPYYTFK